MPASVSVGALARPADKIDRVVQLQLSLFVFPRGILKMIDFSHLARKSPISIFYCTMYRTSVVNNTHNKNKAGSPLDQPGMRTCAWVGTQGDRSALYMGV